MIVKHTRDKQLSESCSWKQNQSNMRSNESLEHRFDYFKTDFKIGDNEIWTWSSIALIYDTRDKNLIKSCSICVKR